MRTTSYPAPQPEGFSFSVDNLKRAETICARYPEGRKASATIALLDLAQRQNGGWLSAATIEYVAQYLAVAPIRVYEVASFYSMFNMQPVGKHFIQVCRTTPCWLRGSDGITEACKKKLGVGLREVTEDGLFSIVEVECLGACANAPMVQINDFYYEDLTPERMAEIIDALRAGEEVTVGSQTGRLSSAPEGGPKTLLNLPDRADSTDQGAGAEGDD
jgi:NADH-quinone oxidoreductase subunit E